MARSSAPLDDRLVPIWFAIGLVFALLVGTCAGILGWLSGQDVAAALLTGGMAFGGTVTLVALVINLLCKRGLGERVALLHRYCLRADRGVWTSSF